MIFFLKRNKIFTSFVFLTLLSFLIGFFFYANLPSESREVVASNLNQLIEGESTSLSSNFIHHLFVGGVIWICGISIVGIFLVIAFYFLEVFLFSFESTAFLSIYGFHNLLFFLFYSIPALLFLISLFFLCYYSSSFSLYLFRFLFFHKHYSFSSIMKRYLFIFLFCFIGICLSSLFEYFFFSTFSKIIF